MYCGELILGTSFDETGKRLLQAMGQVSEKIYKGMREYNRQLACQIKGMTGYCLSICRARVTVMQQSTFYPLRKMMTSYRYGRNDLPSYSATEVLMYQPAMIKSAENKDVSSCYGLNSWC